MIYKINKINNRLYTSGPLDIRRMSRETLSREEEIENELYNPGIVVGSSFILVNDKTQAGKRHLACMKSRI